MPRFLWTQKQDMGPTSRSGHSLAFDAARGRIVLFGGNAVGSLFNDTWEWNGKTWTQVEDIGPSARQGLAMAYDASRQRVVLFGGMSGSSKLSDTWEWSGENWTQVEDIGPQPRSGHAMTFDSAKGRVVLFGGESASGLKRDTWEWDGQEWTQQQDIGPSRRKGHAMASSEGRTVLFGGVDSSGSALGDTWVWDGQEWTEQQDIGPDACVHAAMVSTGTSVILFGGVDSIDEAVPAAEHAIFGNTWEWNGQLWTQVQDIGPKGRWLHAMAFDGVAGRVVLFGGLSSFAPAGDPALEDALLGDTWEHEAGASPAGVTMESLSLNPTVLTVPGDQSIATFTLSGPSSTNLEVFMGAFVDESLTQPVSFQALDVPVSTVVNAGDTSGWFPITRGNEALPPGPYLIVAGFADTVVGAWLDVMGPPPPPES
jgi:Galactose oxidase, central domain